MTKITYEAAELENAAFELLTLLQDAESPGDLQARRDEVMKKIHDLNIAYCKWASVIDPELEPVVD